MKTYLFTYRYDGGEYSLEVPADSLVEAKGRVAQMCLARYDGELMAKLPVRMGWFAKLFVWSANLIPVERRP